MNVFEILREQIPVHSVIPLDGHGRKVLCISPGHSEAEPSMHVYEDHVHCFGCGFHADVTDVWRTMHRFEKNIDAALDLAREFNIRVPEFSEEAAQKAEGRRAKEQNHHEAAKDHHAALQEHPCVVEWWEGRGFTADLRDRFLLGAADGGEAATIPFWHRGRIKGIIRRKLQGEPKYILPATEEFPEGHRPLFIPGDTPGGEVLVEGYVDALAAVASGKAAVAIGGTGISEAQIAELAEFKDLYVLPDKDEEGADAAKKWGRDLFPRARICPADYGEVEDDDVAAYFARYGTEETIAHIARLMEASDDALDLETAEAVKLGSPRQRFAYATDNIVPLLERITPESARNVARDIVAKALQVNQSRVGDAIKEHLGALDAKANKRMAQQAQEERERLAEEYAALVSEAQPEIDALLRPGVLGRLCDFAAEMHHVVGDREALELAELSALGAQLEPLPNGRPLGTSLLFTAEASRGKNHIIDAAVRPLPEEFYFAFEIASGQSLYYKALEDPDFLRHTFAYPNEIEGAEALWEFLRPMLSKGRAHKIVNPSCPLSC
ncbi:MAG TPA: toprim domain-containing protein [Rubrobacter sp.]|jgi:DNA primase|nr:toprim domain-containing protein [Rubrobacter sp.]